MLAGCCAPTTPAAGSYQAALEEFGLQGLVELTMVIGQYSALAMAINAFDTDLLPNRTEPLLPV